jgi:Homing endonuclease associated repeat
MRRNWGRKQIIKALRRDAKRRGRPPRMREWTLATKARPCSGTVVTQFGGWRAALAAAGLGTPVAGDTWTAERIVDAMRAWRRETGRWPSSTNWERGAPGRPTGKTVRNIVGSFSGALAQARAGL